VTAGLILPVLAREDEEEAVLAAKRAGFGGLAGSYQQVAEALDDYTSRGVGEFFLEPPDPVADGYLLGQHVLPVVSDLQKDIHHGG
jgi:alkanesulfonate monooxygenase SsuD/methylene tetrahydromethanopterin reductase-like flavin-dependent oxidoreductase (luciferase family)